MTENKDKNMTIEEMIAAGASWNDISTRVRELQRQRVEKERAEKMAQAERARKAEVATAAKERLVVAIVDWVIAEGVVAAEEREELSKEIVESLDAIQTEMRQAVLFKKLLGLQ